MYENLDVIFLAGLFPKKNEEEILKNSKGNVQNAANNFQWEIVNGLDANLLQKPQILNSLYIGSYPNRYKMMKIDTYDFSHSPNTKDINIGFINIAGIKHFSRYTTAKPYIKNWVENRNGRKKVIIAYAMTLPFTRLITYAKKLDSDITTCLIVPDLPQYMNLSSEKLWLYDVLKNIEIKEMKKDLKFIDSFVVLTKYMREALNIKNVPSLVIEGISTKKFEDISDFKNDKSIKKILYSGGLEEKYGVVNLLKSFEKLTNKNYRLIICGSGGSEREVIDATQRDNRIIFKGLLPRTEVLRLQKSSTLLINPRPNNEEYTKYSFPSKILEYLSSGTPVISYKLDGIPDEYFEHIFTVEDIPDGLFKSLKEVLEKPEIELNEKGKQSREFVLREKNSTVQVGKILDMISKI